MNPDWRGYVRPLIPSVLWRAASTGLNFARLFQAEGIGAFHLLGRMDGREKYVQFRALRHPFAFSMRSHHVGAMLSNIWRREYDAYLPQNPTVIVDAGAYIGDLSCHWATRFPHAKIIALEPNPANQTFLLRNSKPYGISVMPVGLWSSCTSLGGSGQETGFALGEGNGFTVIDVPELMRLASVDHIDILKLDVEGAEERILCEGLERWIDRVTCLVVEIHGSRREPIIVARLAKFGFKARQHRSLVTFRRG